MRLVIFTLVLLSTLAHSAEIEIFVPSQMRVAKVPGHTLQIYNLSEPQRVRSSIPKFSSDPKTAQRQAKSFMVSAEGQSFRQRMSEAYQGHRIAMVYGLHKLPAVVFEKGKYVVYGTTDVTLALRDYHNYLGRKTE